MKLMNILIAVAVVFALLVGSEIWWRHHRVHNEFSRKFVHITVGSFVAFWPFFLTWNEIRILSLAFIAGVLISKYFKVFQAIHSVQRPTNGEILFALSVGLITFITNNEWIYMAALLQMSLADGLAAVVGTRYGGKIRYTVFGHTKTLIGTLTFAVTAIAIMYAFEALSGINLNAPFIISLALGASLIENIGVAGTDNLLIPVLVAGILTQVI